ncbi:MAG: hypothetical protein QOG25_120, partial [Acetobacteraceae bacterium]|nr:hypothetical protein [Acetobacteraceae bacterium]
AKVGRAPALGDHNESVLSGLGYSAEQIKDFKNRKVI